MEVEMKRVLISIAAISEATPSPAPAPIDGAIGGITGSEKGLDAGGIGLDGRNR